MAGREGKEQNTYSTIQHFNFNYQVQTINQTLNTPYLADIQQF